MGTVLENLYATFNPHPRSVLLALIGTASLGLAMPAIAQAPVRDDAPVVIETLSSDQLQDVIGPVALYPDDLLAVVLPASAYPLQIVQATRFLDELERDDSLKPDPTWDESVVALLNYPDVLRLMNDDLDWTYDLGAAVVNQQPDVIAAIETFRDRAYNAGNLKSDEHQVVEYEDERITITPVEREVIYVPYYEPERVVVVQPRPVYHYYPQPFPVYYYPYPSYHRFHSNFFWGVSSAYQIGWRSRHLNIHLHNYASHPFFGRSYVNNFYYHHRFQPARYRFRPVSNSRGGYANARNRNYRGDQWRPVSRRNARTLNRTGQRAARINRDTYTRTLRPRDRAALNQRSGARSAGNRQVAPKTGYRNSASGGQRATRNNTRTRTMANTRTASRDAARTTTRNTTRSTATRSRNTATAKPTRQYRTAKPTTQQTRQVASTRRSTAAPQRSQTRQTTTRTRTTTTTRSAPRQSAPQRQQRAPAPQRQSAPAPQRQSAPAQQRSKPAQRESRQSQSRSSSRQGSSRSSRSSSSRSQSRSNRR